MSRGRVICITVPEGIFSHHHAHNLPRSSTVIMENPGAPPTPTRAAQSTMYSAQQDVQSHSRDDSDAITGYSGLILK